MAKGVPSATSDKSVTRADLADAVYPEVGRDGTSTCIGTRLHYAVFVIGDMALAPNPRLRMSAPASQTSRPDPLSYPFACRRE